MQTADKKNGTKMIRINHDGDSIIVDDLLDYQILGQTSTEIGIQEKLSIPKSKPIYGHMLKGTYSGQKTTVYCILMR